MFGYDQLSGAVWSVKDGIFFKFGTWDGRGNSIDLGSYFDILSKSEVPDSFPFRNEKNHITEFNERAFFLRRRLGLS